jgi:alpha-glucosidase
MQWDASPNGGFTAGQPWLPLDPDFASCNVDALSENRSSILSLYRQLIEFRCSHLALSVGDYVPVQTKDQVFAYERRYRSERLLVALNFGHGDQMLDLPADSGQARVLLSTYLDREKDGIVSSISLRPNEGIIVALNAAQLAEQ